MIEHMVFCKVLQWGSLLKFYITFNLIQIICSNTFVLIKWVEFQIVKALILQHLTMVLI